MDPHLRKANNYKPWECWAIFNYADYPKPKRTVKLWNYVNYIPEKPSKEQEICVSA